MMMTREALPECFAAPGRVHDPAVGCPRQFAVHYTRVMQVERCVHITAAHLASSNVKVSVSCARVVGVLEQQLQPKVQRVNIEASLID